MTRHRQVLHEAGVDGAAEPMFVVECVCGWVASPPHALRAYPRARALGVYLRHERTAV